jgi:hypothetical protein
MLLYSSWILTGNVAELIPPFAEQVGEPGPAVFEGGGGRLTTRWVSFADQDESLWARSESRGRWLVGVADIDAGDELGSRLVGMVTPSPGMTRHLLDDLSAHLGDHGRRGDPVTFSLRSVLRLTDDEGEHHPASVRLAEAGTRILVQSRDEPALREIIAGLPGELVGVTLDSTEGRITVTDQGPIIFTDGFSPTGLMAAVRVLGQAASVPAPMDA